MAVCYFAYFLRFTIAMSGDLFDIDVVRDFMLDRNGKVTNHELVTHFKPFLNDPQNRGTTCKLDDMSNIVNTGFKINSSLLA